MNFLIKFILSGIMAIVKRTRKDAFHYLSAPESTLSSLKASQIMNSGHVLPSLVAAFYVALGVIPRVSESYAAQLENNDPIVPITIAIVFIPILIANGFIIEICLEKLKKGYLASKKMDQEEDVKKVKAGLDAWLGLGWFLED